MLVGVQQLATLVHASLQWACSSLLVNLLWYPAPSDNNMKVFYANIENWCLCLKYWFYIYLSMFYSVCSMSSFYTVYKILYLINFHSGNASLPACTATNGTAISPCPGTRILFSTRCGGVPCNRNKFTKQWAGLGCKVSRITKRTVISLESRTSLTRKS